MEICACSSKNIQTEAISVLGSERDAHVLIQWSSKSGSVWGLLVNVCRGVDWEGCVSQCVSHSDEARKGTWGCCEAFWRVLEAHSPSPQASPLQKWAPVCNQNSGVDRKLEMSFSFLSKQVHQVAFGNLLTYLANIGCSIMLHGIEDCPWKQHPSFNSYLSLHRIAPRNYPSAYIRSLCIWSDCPMLLGVFCDTYNMHTTA